MTTERIADHPIEPVFLERWSPRAFDGSAMPVSDLLTILEAARWAPSAYNLQPWRLLYSHREDSHWQKFMTLLDPYNARWAQYASALVFLLSDTMMPGDGNRPPRLSRSHSFDTGAAWAQLALQATSLGYQAHAMAGIDFEQTQEKLFVPERFRVEIAIAIGKSTDPSVLPPELQEREQASQRLSLNEIAFAGLFQQ
ncbi:MAG: nitroreductase family protein [Rhodospirillales bacterium]|jgi:nitroreductase|nr:nitroreductase family protein [Rhodospirillales bacterium]